MLNSLLNYLLSISGFISKYPTVVYRVRTRLVSSYDSDAEVDVENGKMVVYLPIRHYVCGDKLGKSYKESNLNDIKWIFKSYLKTVVSKNNKLYAKIEI